MIASATANSGAAVMSSAVYSPTQKCEAGNALARPASACRNVRNSLLPGVGAQGAERVDHHDPGLALADRVLDRLQHRAESAAVHDAAEIVIEHLRANAARVEERQHLPVADKLVQGFGHSREVERRMLAGRVVEHELLHEHRLARARWTDDEVDRVARQPSAEDRVKSGVAAADPPGHASLPRTSALVPSRSRTAETSSSDLTGLGRTTAASVTAG